MSADRSTSVLIGSGKRLYRRSPRHFRCRGGSREGDRNASEDADLISVPRIAHWEARYLFGEGERTVPTQYMRKYEVLCGAAICALAINAFSSGTASAAAVPKGSNDANTTTPIQHVIVIIGENRTFDHLFATYEPVNAGETVLNLLSEGIVQTDGTPGQNYSTVTQSQAFNTVTYQNYVWTDPQNNVDQFNAQAGQNAYTLVVIGVSG